jgi:uncharacterized protein
LNKHRKIVSPLPRFGLALAAVVLLAVPTAAAESAPPTAELYRAQTIVTGTGEANRLIGFASCLEDVLIKVSGQLRLSGDKRLEPYKTDAAKWVRDFSYRDEKGGKPKNDEQGTRDRSFVLTAEFDEAAINGVLAGLGITPWLSHRPVLAAFVELQPGARRYVVAADSKETDLQRDSLIAAAARRGMPIVLPDAAAVAAVGANEQPLAGIAPAKLAQATSQRGGEALLIARLVWDDSALRWNSDWQLDWQDGSQQARSQRWQTVAVTFDDTFRQGIGGAAQILAGQQ